MINVTNRPDVYVRLRPLKLLLRHCPSYLPVLHPVPTNRS